MLLSSLKFKMYPKHMCWEKCLVIFHACGKKKEITYQNKVEFVVSCVHVKGKPYNRVNFHTRLK